MSALQKITDRGDKAAGREAYPGSVAAQIAAADGTVLISADSPVALLNMARDIHERSLRCGRPFVSVDCSKYPVQDLAAHLFGVSSLLADASGEQRVGRFERADGGTLVVGEVTFMSLPAQARLLRVLQTGAVQRIGSWQTRHLDVRVMATSSRDIGTAVRAGQLREDLACRLKVLHLNVSKQITQGGAWKEPEKPGSRPSWRPVGAAAPARARCRSERRVEAV